MSNIGVVIPDKPYINEVVKMDSLCPLLIFSISVRFQMVSVLSLLPRTNFKLKFELKYAQNGIIVLDILIITKLARSSCFLLILLVVLYIILISQKCSMFRHRYS